MSTIHYCHQWSRHYKEAIDLLSDDDARNAYEARTLYTALLGDMNRPQCFVESNMDYLGVEFLDHHLREHVAYQFQEKRPGRVFLCMAMRRDYIEDSDKVRRGASFVFKEDGSTIVHREDFVAGILERADTHLDVSQNWEAYPCFGDYEALIQRTREKTWGEIWETCLKDMEV